MHLSTYYKERFYLLIFLLSTIGAQAQIYTYPFSNGRAELPAFSPTKNKPIWATYSIRNPQTKSVEVILFQEIDQLIIYKMDQGKLTLLGQSGWLYPSPALQFDQYPEFGLLHRNGFLFRIPPKQTIQIRVVYLNRTSDINNANSLFYPLLFSREGYQHFQNHQLTKHLQTRYLGMIFIGSLLIMFLYTIMQYVILGDRVLSYYALYVLLVLLRSMMADDYMHFIDHWPLLRPIGFVSRHSLSFLYWSLAAYGLFLCEYIQLSTRAPYANAVHRISIGIFILLGLGDILVVVDKFTVPVWQQFHRITDIGLVLFGLYTLYTIGRLYDTVTKFLFWGILFFLLSGIASIINRFIFWGSSTLYDAEVAIFITGYILEMVTFALGIAQRHELIRQEKLQMQQLWIEQLQENERKQTRLNNLRDEIARDLHDEMGSQLSAISILSQTTARLVLDPRVRQRLSAIGQTSRQVMDSMREIVWSLNSTSDSLAPIGLRIQDIAYSLFNETSVNLHLDLGNSNTSICLTEKQKREICLISRECLTNIIRHAKATQVSISLQISPNLLQLIISDNGLGFDRTTNSPGSGLRNLWQRAENLNADLRIESTRGQGTTITLHCPLETESPLHRLPFKTISS
ncbi:sensor histidine kinase [Spirosoma aerolatum]|uniref:sensor histidine kinase n=1 Tax=Spirosoma aerolatum TaxID=1211326 RepID=UPI0014746393|nr:sensor histidine kinase [Spirosoma aerolatum]